MKPFFVAIFFLTVLQTGCNDITEIQTKKEDPNINFSLTIEKANWVHFGETKIKYQIRGDEIFSIENSSSLKLYGVEVAAVLKDSKILYVYADEGEYTQKDEIFKFYGKVSMFIRSELDLRTNRLTLKMDKEQLIFEDGFRGVYKGSGISGEKLTYSLKNKILRIENS